MEWCWNVSRRKIFFILVTVICCFVWSSCSNSSTESDMLTRVTARFDFLDQQVGNYADAPRSDYKTALLYADSLINLMAPFDGNRNFSLLYARAFVRKADVLLFQKRFDEAGLYLFTARKSLSKESDSCVHAQLKSTINGRLANISYMQGRYNEAIASHLSALHYMYQCGSGFLKVYTIQGTLDNLGLCYTAIGHPDSALYYYNQTLDFLNKEEKNFPGKNKFISIAKAVVYGNQGTAWLMKGDTVKAAQAFLQNIAINDREDHPRQDALITKLKLAELFMGKHQLNSADSLVRAIEADTIFLPDTYQLRLLQLKAGRELLNNNQLAANKYLQQYINEKRRLDSSNRQLMNANLQMELDGLHQRYEVKALKRKSLLSTVGLAAAGLLLLMTAAVLFVTMRSRKATRIHASELQQYNRQLEAVLETVEKTNHEYAQLLRVVAHDLKNPLSVIYMLTELMTVQEGKPQEDIEMLQLIRGASTNMNTIIQDLLVAKRDVNATNVRRENVNLAQILRQSADLLKYRANKKHQRLIVARNADCVVYINYEEMWRVINNLLVNAIKFSKEHTVINVNWNINAQEVIFFVQDQGIGIPYELQDKIFDQLTEAQRMGTSGEQPFGMGMYISRRIIEAHGGRIWLESVPDRGTTFFVALPLASSHPPPSVSGS